MIFEKICKEVKMTQSRIIDFRDFKRGRFEKNIEKPEEHPIVTLLKDNKKAYNLKAIVEILGMNSNTIRSMLHKLQKRGLVSHKTPFYAYNR